MQVNPLRSSGLGLDRPPASDSVSAPPRLGDPAAGPTAPTPPQPTQPVHAGLRGLDMQRNARVASAQQVAAYLERLSPRLRNLQTDLGRSLAGQLVPADRLQSQRARVDQLWSERSRTSGGELDAQLEYRPGTPATRSFQVRGLDRPAQTRETLTVAIGLPSAARPAVRVVLDPDATAAQQAKAFEQALLPHGVQAQANEHGGVRFSVQESRWPAVRDGLAVQGEGKQFAGGRLSRIAADPQADVLTPAQWDLSTDAGTRQAAQQVGTALLRAELARDTARNVLNDDRAALASAAPAQDGDWAAGFGAEFAAKLNGLNGAAESDYRLQAALTASIWSLGRHRVERLLANDR
jgi:hypothetical protein